MALGPGSIAFVGFNSDGNDNIAFVALEAISSGTVIYFTDNAWNGTAFTANSETVWHWTATSTVAAGSIVTIDNIGSGTLSTNNGSVAFDNTANRGLANSNETVFAMLGSYSGTVSNGNVTPTTFLTAVGNTALTLTNTGLTAGTNALNLTSGTDIGAYTGSRVSQTSFASYLSLINNDANWTKQDATGDQSADGTAPDVPFSTTLFTVCFTAGTRLDTPDGSIPVEDIRCGDLVTVVQNGERVARAVKWVGFRRIDLTTHPRPETAAPVRIRRDAFALGMPNRDLFLSPDHAVFVDGVLVMVRQLINHATIAQVVDRRSVAYYHVELAEHGILLAEGLPAESYLDTGNRGFFSNGGAPLVLHPDLAGSNAVAERQGRSCADLVVERDIVHPIWRRLSQRAADLGFAAIEAETTVDPAPVLDIDGRIVAPLSQSHDAAVFVIPGNARALHLLSRVARPTDVCPWSEDRRGLGLRVSRLVLRQGDWLEELPLDHPSLDRGWWDVERDDGLIRRWTKGRAHLPLPGLTSAAILEIGFGREIAYPLEVKPALRTA